MSDEIELRGAWAVVAARGDGPAGLAADLFDDVVGRHRQAHRRYHGVRHVVWVVRHVLGLAATIGGPVDGPGDAPVDRPRALAAAFFHDAVYDPVAADNEARSALLACRQLGRLGWPADAAEAVAADIRATAGHVADEGAHGVVDVTRAVLLDADLAVLGSDPAAYQAYATGVRGEYGHLDDAAWRAGRSAVLTNLLGRDRLYRTDAAFARWESRARANLAAELATLSPA